MGSGSRLATAACAMALAVAPGGCAGPIEAGDFGGGDPASITSRPAGSAAPTPPPANVSKPAKPPRMPPEAKLIDDVGVRAFIRHYVAVFNHGRSTQDWRPLRALSSPKCKTCTGFTTPKRGRPEPVEWQTGEIAVLFDRKPDAAAAEAEMRTADRREQWTFYFSLARRGDSWVTDQITLIEP